MTEPGFPRVLRSASAFVDVQADVVDAPVQPYHSGELQPQRIEVAFSYDFSMARWTYRLTLTGRRVRLNGELGHALSLSFADDDAAKPLWAGDFARSHMPMILPNIRKVST